MILKTEKQKEYELIDSGNGEKLEKYGKYVLRRPDPEALWEKTKEISIWEKADLKFVRSGTKTKWISKELQYRLERVRRHENELFCVKTITKLNSKEVISTGSL